ncbi:uncharacterized protein LOC118436167 isoform X2 [Folsomia candida]|uniref:uncharacterized protein LOC118436167 isoform X2 n=1 Tax=Folsomia candida TaxID=158441 RepID=UPI001604E5BB|nr:uncharacterized protein LOC118436167 isoform X2 [Folsomia candida]
MFGRSGQMFPVRQRAFHDAIYEEEYGSDQGDECCQGRGMSAIFCWFLSVIILIGLAASIVLTVFFLLKSKNHMSKNGELDLLFDGDNGINFHLPDTTTELSSINFSGVPSSSRESSGSPGRTTSEGEVSKNGGRQFTMSVATSTRFPPSRKGPHQIFKESEEDEPLPFQSLYPNGKSTSSERNAILGKHPSTTSYPTPTDQEADKTGETGEESSSSEEDPQYLTTTSRPAIMQHILFTSPPLTTTTTGSRRHLQTTRFPSPERTSFTTSTESLESDSENGDNSSHETDDKGNRPPIASENEDLRTSTNGDYVTTSSSSTADRDNITYKAEESQLNKMLLDEIPPHGRGEERHGESSKNSQEDVSKSTEFNLSPPSSDPLARIIKNLAPRWGRNRTVETTTMTSGSHKYDFTISSREKNLSRGNDSTERKSSKERYSASKERGTSYTFGGGSSSTFAVTTSTPEISTTNYIGGEYGLNTVESPNLSKNRENKDAQEDVSSGSRGENPFLDILVGSEDHKTLVTKETEDGIVTSAILPPWYDTPPAVNNSTILTNTTHPAPQENESGESSEESSEHDNESSTKDAEQSASSSVLGGIFDFFNKLPMNRIRNTGEKKPPEDYNPKRIILKRPGGELTLPQGVSSQGKEEIQKNKNETTNQEVDNGFGSANINTILPSNIMTTTIVPDAVVTDEHIRPANNGFHYESPNGGTNIYGYYPDDDDKDNDKTVEHHMVQSETLSDPNELMGGGSSSSIGVGDGVREKVPEKSPSHSIELQINSDASSEVVIEQDQGQEEEEEDETYHPYTRYGETHHASGSEIRKQIVEPPQSLPSPLPTRRGDGIRRPIINAAESTDLEMKGSENRPVFSNTPTRNIPPSLIRQRGSLNNNNNNNTNPANTGPSPIIVKTTTNRPNFYATNSYVPNSSSINEEVSDNSAEQEHASDQEETQDFRRKSYLLDKKDMKDQANEKHDQGQQQFYAGSGSFEGGESGVMDVGSIGSGERPGKWSRPDPNNSMEQQGPSLEQKYHILHDSAGHNNPQDGSVEVKVSPNSEDENDVVVERKPISTLDETLYPDHSGSGSIENIEGKNVFQVFPVGYSSTTTSPTMTTTTERPGSEFTISEPDKSEENKSNVADGFVPPTPVNFHENMYTFSPPSSDSIYQSKDGWRPLVYNDGDDDSGPTAPAPIPTRPATILFSHPPPPTSHWRDRLIARQPVVTIAPMIDLSTAASENSINNQYHISGETDHHEEEEEEDEEDAHHEENESQESVKQQIDGQTWDATHDQNIHSEESGKLKFPQEIEQHHDRDESNNNANNVHHVQQIQIPPHNNFHQNQPQIQRVPMQIPAQQSQQQHQQFHQQQQQQQQQHHHQNRPYQFQNNIDRSKYMMRPAPPPIVMRRTPIHSPMGYRHPHNVPLPPRPQLIPQVQQIQHPPHQFNNNVNAPPTEFQNPQQNLVNRRRFKTLGARPRGSVTWSEGKHTDTTATAERRDG